VKTGGGPVGAAAPLGGVAPSGFPSEVAVNFVFLGARPCVGMPPSGTGGAGGGGRRP
jgi:hypothetical protein